MSTAIPTDPNVMIIDGREIRRHMVKDRDIGCTYWHYKDSIPATTVEQDLYDERTGETSRLITHVDEVIRWEAHANHSQRFTAVASQVNSVDFDPREPSPIHDEMERAIAAGFEAWGAQLAASNKVKPRPQVEGRRFELGDCRVSRKLPLGAPALRELLHSHQRGKFGIHGDLADIALDEQRRFCPALFGRTVENAVAIESGEGLIVSRLTTEIPERDHWSALTGRMNRLDVDIVTMIVPGRVETLAWYPDKDGVYLQ